MRIASAQPTLQLLAVTPAQPQSGSIFHQHLAFAVRSELQALDAIEVHDGRTVDGARDGSITRRRKPSGLAQRSA
jgi:hypothetical protein